MENQMEQTSENNKYNFTKKDILCIVEPKANRIGMTNKITCDISKLLHDSKQQECTLEEGIEIGDALLKFLQTEKVGLGISAIQFGIPKRVCAIMVKEPIILVNPTIEVIEGNIEFPAIEGCLSIKNRLVKTKRNSAIKVGALNLGDNFLYADVTDLIQGNYMKSFDVLEMVAVQHEIDHTNGTLMTDRLRKWINKQLKRDPIKDIGRNTFVKARNIKTGEEIEIKFKKIEGNKDWVVTPLS